MFFVLRFRARLHFVFAAGLLRLFLFRALLFLGWHGENRTHLEATTDALESTQSAATSRGKTTNPGGARLGRDSVESINFIRFLSVDQRLLPIIPVRRLERLSPHRFLADRSVGITRRRKLRRPKRLRVQKNLSKKLARSVDDSAKRVIFWVPPEAGLL